MGYSGFGNNASALIAALKGFDINALIDVRSSPYSAYYSEFNKETLESYLRENGIGAFSKTYDNYTMRACERCSSG